MDLLGEQIQFNFMNEIPFNVNNQLIEDNYDIKTSLDQIFRYYGTMIRRSINVGDAKESESNLNVNISKIDTRKYQILKICQF